MTALGASRAGKAMRENAAFEIPSERAFYMGWAGSALSAIVGEFEPGGEVRLHGAIAHGTFGPATAIDIRKDSTRAKWARNWPRMAKPWVSMSPQ